MSVTDTDSDSDSDYDVNNDNYNNNDSDNDNNLNNNNSINIIQNNKVIEFMGSINGKAGWLKCLYCDRFHPLTMYLKGMEYCGHCWAWLNSNQLDLEKGIYKGPNPLSEIKNYLKETFKLHDPIKCTNVECIYNKIVNFEKNKKLHIDFCIELGYVKKQEPSNKIETNNSSINKSNFNINKKSSKRINYKLSYITI